MNLVTKLVSNDTFIEGIHKEEVTNILNQRHPSIRISLSRHGNIILSNNKIIKCVSRYYADSSGQPFLIRKSSTHQCHEVRKAANIDCPTNSCISCHLQCLEKLKEGNLTIKY